MRKLDTIYYALFIPLASSTIFKYYYGYSSHYLTVVSRFQTAHWGWPALTVSTESKERTSSDRGKPILVTSPKVEAQFPSGAQKPSAHEQFHLRSVVAIVHLTPPGGEDSGASRSARRRRGRAWKLRGPGAEAEPLQVCRRPHYGR